MNDAGLAVTTTARRDRATMKDVALHAQVGLKTVSRVVNGESGVKPDKVARVNTAIRELGFRRNESARLLRQGSTASIGLLIQTIADPFYSAIADAIEEVTFNRGSLLLTAASSADEQRAAKVVRAFCSRRLDGLIVTPVDGDNGYLREEMADGTPMVFIDQPPRGIEGDMVLTDNFGGARDGVEHLIAHGHTRIACFSHRAEFYTISERIRGYRSALEGAGVEPDSELVYSADLDTADFANELHRMLALPSPPTAIFCTNNRSSAHILKAMLTIDPKPAFVGFDDFEMAEAMTPAITVVAQDPAEMGRRAVHLLFGRMAGDTSEPRTELISTRVIERGSGEAPPSR